MPGSSPTNKNNSAANLQMQQQLAQQRQAQGGTVAQQQQQIMIQMQQQQMKLQQLHQTKASSSPSLSRGATTGSIPNNNPLAPAPSSLARPSSLASSTSTGSFARAKSKTGGPKAATMGRGVSTGFIPPPTTLKAATSSVGSIASSMSPTSEQMTQQLLVNCGWKDKTIWVARQLLGGNATNGFLRATASVQRIKRQRARQTAQSKLKAAAKDTDPAAAAASKDKDKDSASKDKDASANKDKDKDAKETKESKEAASTATTTKKRDSPDQASEEALKKDIMNPRTAKKLKAELQAGLNFCVILQNTIRSILLEMDPQVAPHTPLPLNQGGEIPTLKMLQANAKAIPAAALPVPSAVASATTKANAPLAKAAASTPDAPLPSVAAPQQKQQQRRGSDKTAGNKNAVATATQASPGGESGSTLRKSRKKKLPPCTEPVIELSEFDIAGKRYSRKEHFFRIFECTRFRALKVGDFVAARVSSRDLWILARVQKDYPGFTIAPSELLKLSEARRDAQFKDKVAIKDVEDKEGGVTMVPRNLVLPLPRTFSEAADWAQRSMKKSRVYAMYPNTTSLYSATVVDNTTYCRGDDDILVVEFDGDEAVDASGVLPKYHIPSRFVTLIPREFPAAQTNSKKRKSVTAAQASILPNAANDLASPASVKTEVSLGIDDALGGMVSNMGFDDLQLQTDSLEDFGFDFSEDA